MDYLLKVNIALILFYIFYKLFLSSDTFFAWRRVALISFIAVSFILPLLKVEDWFMLQAPVVGLSMFYANVIIPAININQVTESISWQTVIMNWGVVIYYIIVIFLVGRFVIQLSSMFLLARKSEKCIINNVQVYKLQKDIAPFSFFKMIFINPESHSEEDLAEILTHEQVHANQYHSIDVILSELACIVFWYNPFVWFLKGEIRNNLEFLADNEVLHEGFDTKKYQYHLLGLTYKPAAVNLYNNFNVLHLKKRIRMMNKERTKRIGKVKYLLLLPMVAVMIVCANLDAVAINKSISSKSEKNNVTDTESKVHKVVEVMPEFPGGMDAFSKWLSANLTYPVQALEKGIDGVVVARFVVKADGSIGTIELLKKVHPLLDAEAERVLKTLPKFKPGMSGGKAVDVYFTIPLTFALTKESAKTITVTP